jgi:hypothetical protein
MDVHERDILDQELADSNDRSDRSPNLMRDVGYELRSIDSPSVPLGARGEDVKYLSLDASFAAHSEAWR